MSEKLVTATTEGMRKRGRPRKRWTDEVEEDLKVIGIRNKRTVATEKEWIRIFIGRQGPQRALVLKKKNKLTKCNLTC